MRALLTLWKGSTYRYASARKAGPLTHIGLDPWAADTPRNIALHADCLVKQVQEVNDVWAPDLSAREECRRGQGPWCKQEQANHPW